MGALATSKEGLAPRPLVVDLDDTLVRTDVLLEQLLHVAKTQPHRLPAVLYWLARDKVRAKRRLADLAPLDPKTLPYRDSVLDLIGRARAEGRTVLLASASHAQVVREVAAHLGLFDGYLATLDENLKGDRKLKAIEDRLGGAPFDYVGDSAADLAVWAKSASAVAVEPSAGVERRLRRLGVACVVLTERRSRWRLILRQMRIRQWVKNLLVFIPVLAAHRVTEVRPLAAALLACVAFSLAASTVYVLNDLLDVQADRAHHSKKLRPFASGALGIRLGMALWPLLLVLAGFTAAFLPPDVVTLLAGYFVLNLAYSFKLKGFLIIDTVVLAAFYTLRILVGGAAAGVPVSQWLFAFSVFFFFGLAMVKRYTELHKTQHQGNVSGRGYVWFDQLPVFVMGVSSSLVAVLILVLYLNSSDVGRLYSHWQRLWMVTPIMLYWSARTWLLAHRGEIDDDPVAFAVRDRVSWVVMLVLGATILAAL